MTYRSDNDYQTRALALWRAFTDNERQLVSIGVFPNDAMTQAEREGFRSGALAVALMTIQRAASTLRFRLGKVVATPGALKLFEEAGISGYRFLARHVHGDWGEVDPDDQRANDAAVVQGTRILSAYSVGDQKLWVITEADRSSTCLLLPSEY